MTDDALVDKLVHGLRPAWVTLAEPDPRWAARFAARASELRRVLGDRALLVEHIGSTSVPRLAAKPVVDIVVGITDPDDEPAFLPDLLAAGYELRVREPGHRCLRAGEPDEPVNLHCYRPDDPEIRKVIVFRDRLRAGPAFQRGVLEAVGVAAAARPATNRHLSAESPLRTHHGRYTPAPAHCPAAPHTTTSLRKSIISWQVTTPRTIRDSDTAQHTTSSTTTNRATAHRNAPDDPANRARPGRSPITGRPTIHAINETPVKKAAERICRCEHDRPHAHQTPGPRPRPRSRTQQEPARRRCQSKPSHVPAVAGSHSTARPCPYGSRGAAVDPRRRARNRGTERAQRGRNGRVRAPRRSRPPSGIGSWAVKRKPS